MLKVFYCLFSTLLFSQSVQSARMSSTEYGIGGLAGTFLGLGVGHAIQGRWWSDYGWAYTSFEVIGIGLYLKERDNTNYSCSLNTKTSFPVDNCKIEESKTAQAGLALYLITHLAEVIDVWWLPDNMSVGVFPDPSQPVAMMRYDF